MPKGADRLTPGQREHDRLLLVGEPESRPIDLDTWQLEITGRVGRPLELSFDAILSMPSSELVSDTICVTGWTHLDTRWRGVWLATMLEEALPQEEAHFLRFLACSYRNHDSSLPLDYAREHVLLAYELDGKPLDPVRGFPLRAVTRGRYFYKSVKWLRQIELLAEDQPGYWERGGYHNNADPVLEQRYVPLPLTPVEFERRRAARDFRGAVAIRDPQFRKLDRTDLSGANFQGAQIKACSLGGLVLRGARCEGANFTRCDFRLTDLRDANLYGCDLEGASFINADLRGADLRETALTATRFYHSRFGARLTGARFCRGALNHDNIHPDERRYLIDPAQGALLI
jgi:DMSO/TMAO reductase YedYZ molybdopterin-dependent catalytic subunit